MKLIAFDTSTEFCSAALWLDGATASREQHAGQSHSELLLPMIDRLLAEAGLKLAQLDAVAFGEGPGAFTGLRIACGVAQGLAFGADLPVIGVGTLLALAEAAGGERAVCAIDARMREVYHAAYRRDAGEWRTVHAPSLCAPEQAPELPDGEWTACGNGFAAYRDALLARYGGRLARIEAGRVPHAREIARLAAPMLARGLGIAAERAAPVYLRDKVALRTDERAAR